MHNIHLTLALYSKGEYLTDARAWNHIFTLVQTAFDWNPLRYVNVSGRKTRRTGDRAISTKSIEAAVEGFVDGRYDRIEAREFRAQKYYIEPVPPNNAGLIARRSERNISAHISDPLNELPCDLSLNAEPGSDWPRRESIEALFELARISHSEYGCVGVTTDSSLASSEMLLITVRPWNQPDPDWLSVIRRYGSYRHLFGTKARDAYWGNFLPEHIVQAVGGENTFRQIGAAVVERVTNDLLYVQLTSTLAQALSETGAQRLEQLRTLLAPHIV